MKALIGIALGSTLLVAAPDGTRAEQSNIDRFAYLTQDSISLVEGELLWNQSETTLDELRNRIPSSYSLIIDAYNPDFRQLMAVLQMVNHSTLDERLITLNLFAEEVPRNHSAGDLFSAETAAETSDTDETVPLRMEEDGRLLLSGLPVTPVELPTRLPSDCTVSFSCRGTRSFSKVYEVLQVLKLQDRSRTRLMIRPEEQLRIDAKVIEIRADGTEATLSAPSITTTPGYGASMGVTDGQPRTGKDLFLQNGRSGGGVSFSVLPQVIGDYIKLTGAVSIKRIIGSEAFAIDGQSIRNYSTETIVLPFAYVFAQGTDSVEFDAMEAGERKLVLHLRVYPVSDQGAEIGATGR